MASFELDISNFITQVQGDMNLAVKAIVSDVIDEVDSRTKPGVDGEFYPAYKGGHLKKNWQLGVESAPTNEIDGVDPTGTATVSGNKAAIPVDAVDKTYYLVNNAPYANVVEYGGYIPPESKNVSGGFSKKMPHGMVGVTVAKFPAMVAKRVKEVF